MGIRNSGVFRRLLRLQFFFVVLANFHTAALEFDFNSPEDYGGREDISGPGGTINIDIAGSDTLIAVWESYDDVSGAGSDFDIHYVRSTDGGATWSAVSTLNPDATTDARGDLEPSIATDGAGNWIVVWVSFDVGGSGNDQDIVCSRSSNDGVSWTSPILVNSNATIDNASMTDDSSPRIASDGIGTWIVTWTSAYPDLDWGAYASVSTNNGASWGSRVEIEDDDVAIYKPAAIATDELGSWVVVWESFVGSDRDIYFSRSTNNGTSWSSPAHLNTDMTTDAGQDSIPAIATDGLGTWIAVWTSTENLSGAGNDEDIFFARSTDGGASWGASGLLNSHATTDPGEFGFERRPQIATDGKGRWLTSWSTGQDVIGNGTDGDLLQSHSTDGGATWSDAVLLHEGMTVDATEDAYTQDGYELSVHADGSGNWIAAWYAYFSDLIEVQVDQHVMIAEAFVLSLDHAFVDFDEVANGDGSEGSPLNNFADAIDALNIGATMEISPSSTSETGSIALESTLINGNPGGGLVRIGDSAARTIPAAKLGFVSTRD